MNSAVQRAAVPGPLHRRTSGARSSALVASQSEEAASE